MELSLRTMFALAALAAAAVSLQGAPRIGGDRIDISSSTSSSIDFGPISPAISPVGKDYRQNIHFTWNGNRDAAILTYTTLSEGLWAHYYDGSTFTPGVRLAPPDGDPASVIGDRVVVAFINTAGSASPLALARNGDAIVFFTAVDNDEDGASALDGENRALYASYFDAGYATSGAKNYGFQKTASRVSTEDEVDENVICHGVVTDGLVGEARWLNYQYKYSYGDATTGLSLFWTQAENIDGDAEAEDLATHAVFFDLEQPGYPDVPLAAGPEIRLPTLNFGASDSGSSAAQTRVEPRYLVYNNLLIGRCAANASGLGAEPDLWGFGSTMHNGDDITLQAWRFDLSTGSVGAPVLLSAATPAAGDSRENNAMPLRQDGSFLSGGHAMYGSDEGLDRDILVFAELSQGQASTTWGTLSNNARISAVELDPATGAVAGRCFLDGEDPLITDSVGSTTADCRLSRNGDYVIVAWLEDRNAGGLVDKALYGSQINTARGGTAPTSFSSRVSPSSPLNTDIDDYSVTWFCFEEGLEYVTGSQSNPLVMNIFYEQSCHIDDAVWGVRVIAGSPSLPAVFSSACGIVESFVDGSQPGMGSVNEEHYLFNGTDRGSDGWPITYYIKEDTSDPKFGWSLYAETSGPGAATARIDRPHSYSQVDLQGLPMQMTPAGSEVAPEGAGEDSKRSHSWTRVHVFWTEDRAKGLSDEGAGLFTRFYDVSSTADTLGGRFVPSAAKAGKGVTEPEQMDWEGSPTDVSDQPSITGLGRDGDRAGVWFTARGQVWYQEFGPGKKGYSWAVHGGSGHPLLLSDEGRLSTRERSYRTPRRVAPGAAARSVGPMKAFFPHPGTSNTLDGTLYFWTKEIYSDGLPLLFGRARLKD